MPRRRCDTKGVLGAVYGLQVMPETDRVEYLTRRWPYARALFAVVEHASWLSFINLVRRVWAKLYDELIVL